MEAGVTVRSVTGVAAADYVRPSSAPVQQAVATELAPANTVSAAPNVSNIRQESLALQNALSAQDAQSRVTLIDSNTREIILRVIDSRTHQVIRQIPDQALLRMRAYAKALQRGETPVTARRHADMAI